MYLAILVTFLANELIFIVFPFIKRSLYKDVLAGMCVCGGGGGGGRGGQKSFIRGGSAARSNPLKYKR